MMIYLLFFFFTTLPLQSMENFRDFPIQRSKSDDRREKRKSLKLKKSTSSTTSLSSTSSSHSLSPSAKPKKEKNYLPKLKKSSSSSSPSSSIGSYGSLPSSPRSEKLEATITDTLPVEHPFIEAVSNKKHLQIVFYLKNRHLDPNIYSLNGEAAIHIAAKAKDYDTLKLLLNDYRTDFSQKTKSEHLITHYIAKSTFIASQLNLQKQLSNEELELEKQRLETEQGELLQDIFARFNLDMVTNEACSRSLFYLTKFIEEDNIPEQIFVDMISTIRTKIKKDVEKQSGNKKNNNIKDQEDLSANKEKHDREMPEKSCFSTNTTDAFIKDKIRFVLIKLSKKTTP